MEKTASDTSPAEARRDTLAARSQDRVRFSTASIVCPPILFAATGAVIYLIVKGPESQAQYYLTVALLCFTLSSITELLFSPAYAHIKGTLGVFAVHLGGTAAVWVAAFLLVTAVVRDPNLARVRVTDPNQFEMVRSCNDFERRDCWLPFVDWKKHIAKLSSLFEGDEEFNVRILLAAGLMDGEARDRLANSKIETLFIYLKSEDEGKTHVVKLQRVRGTRQTTKTRTEVYCISSPTGSSGTMKGAAFSRDGDSGTIHPIPKEADQPFWQEVKDDRIDVFMITEYHDKPLKEGDWVLVHTPKYTTENNAQLDLAVASNDRMLLHAEMWKMRGALLGHQEVPLVFQQQSPVSQTIPKALLDSMNEWLRDLTRFAETGPDKIATEAKDTNVEDVRGWLKRVLPQLASSSVKPVQLTEAQFRHRISYSADAFNNAAVLTYRWSKDMSSLDR
ncbi:MAG: hypothetical protein ABFE01_02060 [Phycisphaerales bacterium]